MEVKWFVKAVNMYGMKIEQNFKNDLSLLQMASANDARYGQKESTDQNFDYMFKILIIGNSSVGKTSFLFRYADDSFTPAFVSTVGIDFKVKTIYRNDKRIKLQIWVRSLSKASYQIKFVFLLESGVLCQSYISLILVKGVLLIEPRHFPSNYCIFQDTAGQERYRTITTAYYRGAMGFILMYDITNGDSFNAVQDWYDSAYFCLYFIKLTHLQRYDLVSVKLQAVLRAFHTKCKIATQHDTITASQNICDVQSQREMKIHTIF